MLHIINYHGIFASRISEHAARAKYYNDDYAYGDVSEWSIHKFNHQFSSYTELGLDYIFGFYDEDADDDAPESAEVLALRRSIIAVRLRKTFPLLFKDTIRVCNDCAAVNEDYEPEPEFVAKHMLPCRCGTREYRTECIAFTERLKADLDPEDIRDVLRDDSLHKYICWSFYTGGAQKALAKGQRIIDAAVRCGYVRTYTGPYIGDDIERECPCGSESYINHNGVLRNQRCDCEIEIEKSKCNRILREVSRIDDFVHHSKYDHSDNYYKVCAVLDDIRADTAAKVAALAYARDRDAFSLALTLGAKLDSYAACYIARAFYP
jgi:hypothetical protein